MQSLRMLLSSRYFVINIQCNQSGGVSMPAKIANDLKPLTTFTKLRSLLS